VIKIASTARSAARETVVRVCMLDADGAARTLEAAAPYCTADASGSVVAARMLPLHSRLIAAATQRGCRIERGRSAPRRAEHLGMNPCVLRCGSLRTTTQREALHGNAIWLAREAGVRKRKAMERPWQTLVRELRDDSFTSPYLERLRSRHDVAAAQQQLERDIIREMAEALGRAGEKVDLALLELDVARRALSTATDANERARLTAAFNARRAEALKARQELRVHREAVGIRRNDCLDAQYPIPPRA